MGRPAQRAPARHTTRQRHAVLGDEYDCVVDACLSRVCTNTALVRTRRAHRGAVRRLALSARDLLPAALVGGACVRCGTVDGYALRRPLRRHRGARSAGRRYRGVRERLDAVDAMSSERHRCRVIVRHRPRRRYRISGERRVSRHRARSTHRCQAPSRLGLLRARTSRHHRDVSPRPDRQRHTGHGATGWLCRAPRSRRPPRRRLGRISQVPVDLPRGGGRSMSRFTACHLMHRARPLRDVPRVIHAKPTVIQ